MRLTASRSRSMAGPLFLEGLDQRDEVPDLGLRQRRVGRHRARLADGAPALGDRVVHLLVGHALESGAHRPVARHRLGLGRVRPVTGAAVAMAFRTLLLIDLGGGLRVSRSLGEHAEPEYANTAGEGCHANHHETPSVHASRPPWPAPTAWAGESNSRP